MVIAAIQDADGQNKKRKLQNSVSVDVEDGDDAYVKVPVAEMHKVALELKTARQATVLFEDALGTAVMAIPARRCSERMIITLTVV